MSEQAFQVNKQGVGTMTPAEQRSIFWRSFTIQGSWSFDKMMAYGCMYALEKPLRRIYSSDDDFYAALERHTETFNITPHVSPFVLSLAVAMEEEAAKNPDFDVKAINNLKVGLMGPLSGIGDSFFVSSNLRRNRNRPRLDRQHDGQHPLFFFVHRDSFCNQNSCGKTRLSAGNPVFGEVGRGASYGTPFLRRIDPRYDRYRRDDRDHGLAFHQLNVYAWRYGNRAAVYLRSDLPEFAAPCRDFHLRLAA